MDKLLGVGVVGLAGMIIPLLLSRHKTQQLGFVIGKLISKVFRQKLGPVAWEKQENRLQTTLSDFVTGLNRGLDKDDNRKEKNS